MLGAVGYGVGFGLSHFGAAGKTLILWIMVEMAFVCSLTSKVTIMRPTVLSGASYFLIAALSAETEP
jgi:hypothetical protein